MVDLQSIKIKHKHAFDFFMHQCLMCTEFLKFSDSKWAAEKSTGLQDFSYIFIPNDAKIELSKT